MSEVVPFGAGKTLLLETLFTRALERAGQTPTPAQVAICRVADGKSLGKLWSNATVRRIFKDARPPKVAPKYMVVLAGIRGAKSLLSACKAACASQNIDLSMMSEGAEVRIPVLSTDVDLAKATFSHLLGLFQNDPDLQDKIVKQTADALVVKHPSGHNVEIKVTAMARAGTTLVARWLAGAIFDEAPRMMGDESVKSLGESLKAIGGRMLPGSQIWLIGSPHAPFGPVYDLQAAHFGKPSETYVVVRAQGPDLNPVWWTPGRCKAQQLEDEDVYQRDVLAEFADPKESIISSVDLDRCTRADGDTMRPLKGFQSMAYMDPATRGNGWTLHIVQCVGTDENNLPKYELEAYEWRGSKMSPLSPRATLTEIRDKLKPFDVTEVQTDQWSVDAFRDIAEPLGLDLTEVNLENESKLANAKKVSILLRTRRLSLPHNNQLRTDLLMAKNRVTQNGATLVLPKTGDGRHCDNFPPLLLMVNSPPSPPEAPPPPPPHGDWQDVIDRLDSPEDGWATVASVFM